MNTSKKKLLVIAVMTLFVIVGIAAINPPQARHKNLKVLPQDISDEKLDSIMHSYNVALGVKCNFCHLPIKDFKDSLDYAADGEPMKEEARKMIEMNIYINKTWFNYKNDPRPEYLTNVTCNTCHKGEAFPEH
jgi:hypothetical protein